MGPPKWQRIVVRIGAFTCVLLVAMWLVTLRYTVILFPSTSVVLAIYGGGVGASFWQYPFDEQEMIIAGGTRLEWLPRIGSTKPALQNAMLGTSFIPFWIPLVAIGVPTALLIRRMRRWKHEGNLCKSCGYDLTGHVSGTCSECGASL